MEEIVQFYTSIPMVTRCFMTCSFALAIATTYELLNPLDLYFGWGLVFRHGEWWRLVTTFLFLNKISVNFAFHMHFIYTFMSKLEEHFYFRKTGAFLYMCLRLCVLVMLLSPAMMFPFLSFCLTHSILYIYSRRYPDENLAVFGLFAVPAPYMPYLLSLISFMMGGADAVIADGVGILAGHIVWYFSDILPCIIGWDITAPPTLMRLLRIQ